MKNKSTHIKNNTSLHLVGVLLLFIFINFTVIVPCLNLSGVAISLTEMVEEEEEEQEEHNINLHELMVQSTLLENVTAGSFQPAQMKFTHYSEVLTPPPEIA